MDIYWQTVIMQRNLIFSRKALKAFMKNKKSINNMDYVLAGDYYIPDLKLPNEERPIGKYGRLHREYLKSIAL